MKLIAVWIFVVLSAGDHPAVLERVEFKTEAECVAHRDATPVLHGQVAACGITVRAVSK